MQACIQSFLEAFSLFLVFSVQTKPNKTLNLNVSRSEQQQQQQNFSTLKYTFLIQTQTCQPPVKENLETHKKKSGDSTKNSDILFFPRSNPFSIVRTSDER